MRRSRPPAVGPVRTMRDSGRRGGGAWCEGRTCGARGGAHAGAGNIFRCASGRCAPSCRAGRGRGRRRRRRVPRRSAQGGLRGRVVRRGGRSRVPGGAAAAAGAGAAGTAPGTGTTLPASTVSRRTRPVRSAIPAAPTPVARNSGRSMFARWSGEASHASTTACAVAKPLAMFSPIRVDWLAAAAQALVGRARVGRRVVVVQVAVGGHVARLPLGRRGQRGGDDERHEPELRPVGVDERHDLGGEVRAVCGPAGGRHAVARGGGCAGGAGDGGRAEQRGERDDRATGQAWGTDRGAPNVSASWYPSLPPCDARSETRHRRRAGRDRWIAGLN